MKILNIRCPCCDKQIKIEIGEGGEYTAFFFNEKISDKQVFDEFGICLGVKEVKNNEK